MDKAKSKKIIDDALEIFIEAAKEKEEAEMKKRLKARLEQIEIKRQEWYKEIFNS